MSVEILLLSFAIGSTDSSGVKAPLKSSDCNKEKIDQRRHPNTDDHCAYLIESLRGEPLHIKVRSLIVKELFQNQ